MSPSAVHARHSLIAIRWSNAAYVLNEVRDPVRNLKISGPLALVATGIMYILANVAYYAAATPKEVSASGVTVAAVFIGKVYGPSMERVLRSAFPDSQKSEC